MAYDNGGIPTHLLVGRPTLTSKDFCLMMPGTAYKYDRMVALARARYGWTPLVTGPDDAYRTYAVQVEYKRLYGNAAAAPGTSSHGGWFEGRESGALDIGNWMDVGREKFFALAREVGFVPGYFNGANDTPDEPWHIIDYSPWYVPAQSQIPEEEDEMLMLRIRHAGGVHLCSLGVGVFRHFVGTDPYEWIKNVARADDNWVDVDANNLPALLRTYGCDLKIWDVRNGAFVVLDPLDNSVKSGNMWSAVNAARATGNRVEVISKQTQDYLKKISAKSETVTAASAETDGE